MEWDLIDESAPKTAHTPKDDLESFLWVLFWTPLVCHHCHTGKLSGPEGHLWSNLNTVDVTLQ
jgi:hypothetical protein